MKFKAHQYQADAAQFHQANPFSALFADPGTGKTATMLMLLSVLKRLGDLPRPVLVTSPLRIATSVWPNEIAKWDQFKHLSYQVIHGPKKAALANKPADIHLINNEGLAWADKAGVLDQYKTLIIDESSKFKNWSSGRTKIIRKRVGQFERRHILTGSPTPKSMMDLFAQMYLTDGGKSLGRYITHFRQHYFVDKGWGMYPDWQLRHGAAEMIYDRVAPHCYRLDGQKLLDMPPLIINDIELDLPAHLNKMSLDALRSIGLSPSISAAAEYQQSRRIAGGCVGGELIHDIKIKALGDLLDELQGKPVLCGFYYKEEGRMLTKKFGFPRIDGDTTPTQSAKLMNAWNDRSLGAPGLAIQPAAGGHGLNLQEGGNDVVYYSFTDNQDDYYQLYQRVWRQGVKGAVRLHRLIARKTIDVAILRSVEAKTDQQAALLDAIRDLTC